MKSCLLSLCFNTTKVPPSFYCLVSQEKPLQTAISCFSKKLEFVKCAVKSKVEKETQRRRMVVDLKTSLEAHFCLPVMFQKALSGVCPDVNGSQPHWLSWLCS